MKKKIGSQNKWLSMLEAITGSFKKAEIKEVPASDWSKTKIKVETHWTPEATLDPRDWRRELMGEFGTIEERRAEFGFKGLSVMTSRGPIIIDHNIDFKDMATILVENEDIQRAMASIDLKVTTNLIRFGHIEHMSMAREVRALFIECATNVLTKKIRHIPDRTGLSGIPFDTKSVIFDEFDREELIKQIMDGPEEKKKVNPILKAIEDL